MKNKNSKTIFRSVVIGLLLLLPLKGVYAQDDVLKPGHPDRYVVQEGDTLWEIANKFLKDPWRWPLIWRANENIENPHLIFPGDLLVVTEDRFIKAVRLEPKVYVQPLERAITTIPPHIIEPFLTSALILDPGELDDAGHVVGGVDDELVMGKYDDFYARGMAGEQAEKYRLFRIGRTLRHPETGDILGIEGIHVGESELVRWGDDVSRLHITSSNQEVLPGDRLVAMHGETPLPYYQPHAPADGLTGWIIYAPAGVDEVGKYQIVIVTGGKEDGLEEGHILRAEYHRGTRVDPITKEQYEVPNEESGLMMVIKVFDKLSYALIVESHRQIALGDVWVSP